MIVQLALPVSMTAASLPAIIRGEGTVLHPLVFWLNEQVEPALRKRQGGKQLYPVDIPRAQLTRELADYMIALEGDVFGMPFFFEIDVTRRIPARLRIDADDQRKWTDFFEQTPTRKPIIRNGKSYVGTNVFGDDYLSAKQAATWATNSTTTLIAINDLPVEIVA